MLLQDISKKGISIHYNKLEEKNEVRLRLRLRLRLRRKKQKVLRISLNLNLAILKKNCREIHVRKWVDFMVI
jgi:hypothetical protein